MSTPAPALVRGVDGAAARPSTSLWRAVLARPAGAIAAAVLAALALASLLAPLLATDPSALDPINQLQGPSGAHWFGTDELGRDLFSRVLHAGRAALGIAAVATVGALVLGVVWGGVAAISGGVLDDVLMRAADGVMAIPVMLTALVLVAAFGASIGSLMLILGLLHAPATARIARAGIQVELQSDYCVAARTYGSSRARILGRDILPNVAPTLLVQTSLVAASVILTEAALSFVGLGIQPPDATWGTLILDGYANIYSSYWFVAFPGAAVLATIWALNVLADEIQAALDVRGARR